MIKSLIFAAPLLFASTAILAQTAQDEADTEAKEVTEAVAEAEVDVEVDPDADKEICRRFREIGSRIAQRKVCKTKAEWEEDRAANADALRNPRGMGGPQLGNGG